MSVTVQCVDTGLKIQLPVGTSVSAIKQYLSSHPDVMIPMHEQDGVFLYSKLALKPGHASQVQKVPPIQVQIPEKTEVSPNVLRGLTTNLLLGTIHVSQHNFRYDHMRATSYLDALVKRRNASAECLEAMDVQQAGLKVARNSLIAHNDQKLKQQREDSARFEETLAAHAALFESFDADLEELRKTPLHPALRHGHNWQTLLDCVPDERKLTEWAAKCADEHKRFRKRIESWHKRQQDLSDDLQEEMARRCDVSYASLEHSLQEQDELIAHAKTLEQHIAANLQRVTDFIAGAATVSMSQSQMLEDYDVSSKQHERYLDKLAQMDSQSGQLHGTFREARRKLADYVQARLQAISSFQGLVMKLYGESVIYQQTLNSQEERVRYLEAVHNMPAAYRACEAHLVHRTHFKKDMQEQLQAVNSRLREVLIKEQTIREEFWKKNGAYLPTHLVPGLTDLVPNFRVPEEPFDEQLPAIEDNGERISVDFDVVIAADPNKDKEKEAMREQERYAAQRVADLEKLLAEKAQALDAALESGKAGSGRISSLEEELAAIRSDLAGLRTKEKEKDAMIEQLQSEAIVAAEENGKIAAQLEQAKATADATATELSDELEGANARAEAVEKELALALGLVNTIREVADAAGVALPVADAAASVKERVESASLALKDVAQALGFKKAEATQLTASLEQVEAEMVQLRRRNDEVEARNRDMEEATTASASQLGQKLTVAEAATRAAKLAAEDANARASEARKELEAVKQQTSKGTEELEESRSALEELKKAYAEKEHKVDALMAERVVLQQELDEKTQQLDRVTRETTEVALQLEKEKADLSSSIATSSSLSAGAMQELEQVKAELARERERRTQDARKADAALNELRDELKAVVQERNDSMVETERATTDLVELRNSSQMGLYVAERVKDAIRAMPQSMREKLEVTEMSDPAEVLVELLERVDLQQAAPKDDRPMVAMTKFKPQDYVLFFKNANGVYEALNYGSPHYFLAPECERYYEHEIKNSMCIIGEIVRLEQGAAIENFNSYNLPEGQLFFVVTIAQCDLGGSAAK